MQLFSQYLHDITLWIHINSRFAVFIAFLISFIESLAIIGAIIPGAVIMTTIGILAGSGLMRTDLTLLATLLGAISGDMISYVVGYAFRNKLHNFWPFKRYPHWLEYGKEYFQHNGWKGIILGRFIAPIRSIIPVIAGMMHMHHWRFFIANCVAAMLWTLVYLMPGILIGAASIEFSWKIILQSIIIFIIAIGVNCDKILIF